MRLTSLLGSNDISMMTAWPESPTTMISRIFSETPLSSHLLAVVHCRFTVGRRRSIRQIPRYQLRISGHVDATARLPRRQASGLPWRWVTHRDDAVGLYWISKACFWYKSSKATCDLYKRVNDFGPHTDSIFRGRLIRESDLYASIYGSYFIWPR